LLKLFLYDLKDLSKVKWLWLYLLILLGGTLLFLYMSEDMGRVAISLLNINLLIVPLVSSLFTITYLYDSREFMRFLLTQPLSRNQVLTAKLLAVSSFLSVIYIIGVALPLMVKAIRSDTIHLLSFLTLSGILLSIVFTSLSFLSGVLFRDRVKGVGFIVSLWLYMAIFHDGVILTVVYVFKDYPLEKVVLALTLLNPVDLSRLLVIINLDIAALMGISEAVFKKFFGSHLGITLSILAMLVWAFFPSFLAVSLFRRKDL